MPQIMGQMAITGLTKCHFVCWTPDDLAIWEVEFNQEYWDIELECLKKFWQSWQDNVEPKRSKKPAMPDIVKNRIY
jgi:hypothetical protein